MQFLTDYFIDRYNESMGLEITGIDEETDNIFKNYDWPGNVRELKNVIEGAFNIVESKEITAKNIPKYLIERAAKVSDGVRISNPDLALLKTARSALDCARSDDSAVMHRLSDSNAGPEAVISAEER